MKTNRYRLTSPILALSLSAAAACSSASPVDDSRIASDEGARAMDAGAHASGAEEAGDYSKRGPSKVGYQRLHWQDSSDPLLVKSWYPTTAAHEEMAVDYEIDFKFPGWPVPTPTLVHGQARLDAPVEDGLHPLIVFSHGFGMNPEWYSTLTEHLASHGFVVLAPEHQESDWFETVVRATFERPEDVKHTLDLAQALTADGDWKGRIDMDRVAVVGHSYGGYTALAVAGARIHLADFVEECATIEEKDPRTFLCGPFLTDPSDILAAANLEEVPDGAWPSQSDPRVKSIVAIAGDAFLFGERGLASVTLPVMALGGTADTAAPWDWGAELTYNHVSSERASLVGFVGADHMIPVNTCADLPWTDALPKEFTAMLCNDPAWDRDEALRILAHLTTAFLLDTLNGDASARLALDPQNTSHGDLVWW